MNDFYPYNGANPWSFGYNPNPNPSFPPMSQTAPSTPMQQSSPKPAAASITAFWVNSEDEVRSAMVPAGTSMFFFSRNEPVYWIKATDPSSIPQPPQKFYYYKEGDMAPTYPVPAADPNQDYVTKKEYGELFEIVSDWKQKTDDLMQSLSDPSFSTKDDYDRLSRAINTLKNRVNTLENSSKPKSNRGDRYEKGDDEL